MPFKKGQSGNPRGAYVNRAQPAKVIGKLITAEGAAQLLVDRAKKGEWEALKMVCEYMYGKPTAVTESYNEHTFPNAIQVEFVGGKAINVESKKQ